MNGILIQIENTEDDDGLPTGAQNIDVINAQISLEDALAHIKDDEKHNIEFDAEENETQDERDYSTQLLTEVDALAWPETKNSDGHFVIESAWAGPLNEGGYQWRFIPVNIREERGPLRLAA